MQFVGVALGDPVPEGTDDVRGWDGEGGGSGGGGTEGGGEGEAGEGRGRGTGRWGRGGGGREGAQKAWGAAGGAPEGFGGRGEHAEAGSRSESESLEVLSKSAKC